MSVHELNLDEVAQSLRDELRELDELERQHRKSWDAFHDALAAASTRNQWTYNTVELVIELFPVAKSIGALKRGFSAVRSYRVKKLEPAARLVEEQKRMLGRSTPSATGAKGGFTTGMRRLQSSTVRETAAGFTEQILPTYAAESREVRRDNLPFGQGLKEELVGALSATLDSIQKLHDDPGFSSLLEWEAHAFEMIDPFAWASKIVDRIKGDGECTFDKLGEKFAHEFAAHNTVIRRRQRAIAETLLKLEKTKLLCARA